jgi:pSer/pThr/pTyr-binding forkhead associated (FHA) protein
MPIVIQPTAEEFVEACGGRPPLRLEIEHCGQGTVEYQTLALPFALIGRDDRADIHLDDKSVSRRHAYLQLVAGRWWWVDLDSRTGTHRENEPSGRSGRLDRQGLRIGPYIIRLAEVGSADEEDSAALANPLSQEADNPSLLPRLALDFDHGMGHSTWTVNRPLMVVGRAPFCKIRINGAKASRTHCILLNTPVGLWAVDLLSREGTRINGTAVRWARLGPEDVLQIDAFAIRARAFDERDCGPIALPFKPRRNDVSVVQTVAFSAPALPRNVNESMLSPLVAQFSLMQQQMFEQFQHTLLTMAQMFGKLHQEQVGLIRQELEQIQDLTRQLHTLQSEGMQQESPERPALPETPPAPSSPAPLAISNVPADPVAPSRYDGDVHIWLSQRLATLQQERQTRWQRVLSLVTGK